MDKLRLKQYIGIIKEIDRLEEEREVLFARIQAPPKPDGMPHAKGGVSDTVGNTAVKLATLAKMIDKKLDKLIDLRLEIEASLEVLPTNERHLMRLRYIDGLSWPRVTEKLYGDRADFIDRFDSYLRNVHNHHRAVLRRMKSFH